MINFHHVELENIGLTDDLYIKMNARGKLLSSFENFKAGFEKLLNDNNWEDGIGEVDSFAFLIDTKWTDFLWKHFRKKNSVDEAFMRFISTIVMIRQALERNDDRISIITKLRENPNSLRPDFISYNTFLYLKECFDKYEQIVKQDIDLTLSLPFWRHQAENGILSQIVYEYNAFAQTDSASYTQKVLFYAQTEYLLRVDIYDKAKFLDWMRVIRNIVARGSLEKTGMRPDIIRSPQTFDGVIYLVSELAEGCQDIYSFLSQRDKLSSSFAKYQVDEEKLKSRLIQQEPRNRDLIFAIEDNDLLMGRIEFALYCSGYDELKNNFDYDKTLQIQKVISSYFDKEAPISNDLRRALLTIEINGKYEYYGYWWSFWNVVSANKRCLIDSFRELEFYIYGSHREYFKKLILKLVDEDLLAITGNFEPTENFPNWKLRLINEKDLLDKKSKTNYVAIPQDDRSCYLLRSKRPRDIEGCEQII